MDRRQLLTGMLASAFVAAVPVKAMAKLTTSVSPPMKRDFYTPYDSVAMTYLTEVLGRTAPLPHVEMLRNGKTIRLRDSGAFYVDLVPPDPARAAWLIENERQHRIAAGLAEWDRVYKVMLP